MYFKLNILILLWFAVHIRPTGIQENEAPIVKIINPIENDQFSWNTLIPFAISVRDKEDGYTEYEEIPLSKVILTVQYLSDMGEVGKNLGQDSYRTMETLSLMASLDCFACHKAKEKLIGPSFAEIATQYANRSDVNKKLANKILKGSEGTWGNQIMPAHPNIAKEEAEQMVAWIVNNGSATDFNFFSGTSGAFKTGHEPKGKGQGSYVLTAFYADQGIDGSSESSKIGVQTVILHPKMKP